MEENLLQKIAPWFAAAFLGMLFALATYSQVQIARELNELKEMVYENKIVRNCVIEQMNKE